MRYQMKQRLTKVALAVAGCCLVPAALAWTESGTTDAIQGTIPWIFRSASEKTDSDKGHVTVTVDRGSRTATTDQEKMFHVGDKVTLSWVIGDTEGDLDSGTKGDNGATKETVQWMSYKDASGAEPKQIGTAGSDSYTITEADRGRYIGVTLTPTTQTGIPIAGDQLYLLDLSTDTGGGDNDDDVPSGPVVNDNLKVSIYEDNTTTNLIGSSTKLKTATTYKVLLWSDENGNDRYDTGEDVTANYNYRWRFTGTSLQLGTAGGIVAESWNNQPLVIPVTNAEAKAAFDNSGGGLVIGNDGVQGYGLSIEYEHK